MKAIIPFMLFFQLCSFAQEPDSLNWFPYKTGDMWEYWVWDGVVHDTAQIINIKDSASSEGVIYVTQHRRRINPVEYDPFLDSLSFAVDTSRNEVRGTYDFFPYLGSTLAYRFGTQPGDTWLVDSSGETAEVMQIYPGTVFGKPTTIMEIRYHNGSLTRYWDYMAQGFGLVERFPSERGYWYRIKGAVIDGRLYGDTTRVVTSAPGDPTFGLPETFTLNQNFPNPFNPSTTIRYALPQRSHVTLAVFNMLGQKVEDLVQGEVEAGVHEVRFDASDLGSGVYMYRLIAGGYIKTKTLLLLK